MPDAGGTELARAFVTLSADVKQLRADFDQARRVTESSVSDMQKAVGGMNKMFASLGIGLGFQQITSSISGWIAKSEAAEDLQNRLNVAIEQTSKNAGYTGDKLAGMVDRWKEGSTESGGQLKEMQIQLMRYRHLSVETFERAGQAAIDMAAQGFGSAASNAAMLGRSLDNPLQGMMMLRRMRVDLTAKEKDHIKELMKANKLEEAQGVILSKLETQYGGVAAKLAGTDRGKEMQLERDIEGIKKNIGTVFDPIGDRLLEMQKPVWENLLSGAKALAPFIMGITTAWDKLNKATGDWLGKAALVMAGVGIATGLWAMFGTALTSMVVPAIAAVGTAFMWLLSPIGLTVAAITAAGYVFLKYTEIGQKTTDTIKKSFSGMWEAIKQGDWSDALEVGMLGVQIQFLNMIAVMQDAWGGFGRGIVTETIENFAEIKKAFAAGSTAIAGLLSPLFRGDLDAKQKQKQLDDLHNTYSTQMRAAEEADQQMREAEDRGDKVAAQKFREEQIHRLQAAQATQAQMGKSSSAMAKEIAERNDKLMADSLAQQKEAALQGIEDEKKARLEETQNAAENAEKLQKALDAKNKQIADKAKARAGGPKGAGAAPSDLDKGGKEKGAATIGFADLNKRIQEAMLKDPMLEKADETNELLEQVVENTAPKDIAPEGAAPAGGAGGRAATGFGPTLNQLWEEAEQMQTSTSPAGKTAARIRELNARQLLAREQAKKDIEAAKERQNPTKMGDIDAWAAEEGGVDAAAMTAEKLRAIKQRQREAAEATAARIRDVKLGLSSDDYSPPVRSDTIQPQDEAMRYISYRSGGLGVGGPGAYATDMSESHGLNASMMDSEMMALNRALEEASKPQLEEQKITNDLLEKFNETLASLISRGRILAAGE